jgi:hypothetical protein
MKKSRPVVSVWSRTKAPITARGAAYLSAATRLRRPSGRARRHRYMTRATTNAIAVSLTRTI